LLTETDHTAVTDDCQAAQESANQAAIRPMQCPMSNQRASQTNQLFPMIWRWIMPMRLSRFLSSAASGAGRLAMLLALSVLAGAVLLPAVAEAQGCGERLEQAEQDIYRGRFARAIETLRHCLDHEQPDEETQARAYRLIGIAYVSDQKETEAKKAIRELLAVAPGYEPDPDDNRNYQALVHQVRLELDPSYRPATEETEPERKSGFFKKAIYGVGAAAGVVLAILLLSGDDDAGEPSTELPDPPALP
jgi:tetratricopeptide (TPR) repeat protein